MAVEQAAAAISHLLERVARGRVRGEMTPYYEDDAVTLRRRGGAK